MNDRPDTVAPTPESNATLGATGRSQSGSARGLSATKNWFEVSLVFLLIMVAVWTPMGRVNAAANLLAVVSILWFTARGSYSLRELGFTVPARGTLITLGLGIALAAMVAASGAFLRPIFGSAHAVPIHRAWMYAIWALEQEFILQSFFYLRLESVLGHRRAVWFAGSLFAAAHVPSPVLTVLGFFGALLFCELFHRYRALLPIALAHALLGLTIAASLPDSVLHHMRVGIGYVMYHP
jgi:membrane protease YdiL (CAAX protease family)